MKILSLIGLFLTICLSSCSITQEYHFNRDFSGTTKLSIDMGTLLEMMAGLDSTGNQNKDMRDSLDFVFKESAHKLDSLGMKNINYGWEEGENVLYMSYDFDNIDQLNKALNASSTQNSAFNKTISDEPHVYFTKKGKKSLIYTGPKSKNDISGNKDMESMKEYYKYAVIFNFERKIKAIDNPNVTQSDDKKSAELRGSMFEIIREEYNSDITFKLK